MLKGINLPHSCFDFIVILMRPDALQDSVLIIGQNNVSLSVELYNQMVGERLRAESKNDDSLNTNLADGL